MNAEWFVLNPGQSREFTLRLAPKPAGAISVRVVSPKTVTDVSISHLDRPDFAYGGPSVQPPRLNRETLEFARSGMLPGKFRVWATAGEPGALFTAAADFEVRSGEVTSVHLSLTPKPVLRGKVRTDDGSPLPLKKGEYHQIYLRYPDGGDIRFGALDNGTFQTPVRNLASYRLLFDTPAGWHMISAKHGDRDALTDGIRVGPDDRLEPLEIVLTQAVGTIEVSLPAADGATDGHVLLLRRIGSRVENALHLIGGISRIPKPGTLKWTHIPPGVYWLLASSTHEVPFLEMDFLQKHKAFLREVQVSAGSISRIELRLLRLP
jgi:hypothetical protein